MIRRTLVVAAVAALMAASAHAADAARLMEIALPHAERPLALKALFERAPGVITEDANGLTAGPSQVGVLLLRVDGDGHSVHACVDTEASARRFLEAPVEKIDTRKAKVH